MKVYLEKAVRDELFQGLSDEQKEYLTYELKRSKKTYYANFIAKLTANDRFQNKDEETIVEEIASWELIDYIDAGAVTKKLKCECGKSLRYQYIVQNKASGEIRKFGITHFQEHTGFPPHVAKEIVKGLQEIDFELDEILIRRRDGWKFPLSKEEIELLPEELKKHIGMKLPFTVSQEKTANKLLKKWRKESELFQKEQEKAAFSEAIADIELPDVQTTLSADVQRAVLYYYEQNGSAGLSSVCDWLIEKKIASNERFHSGKAKIYPHIALFLDQLTDKGQFKRSGETKDWIYTRR